MSHSFPIAKTAKLALDPACAAARTRYEAEAAAAGQVIAALETEWLTPAAVDLGDLLAQVAQSAAHGFVQNYEDAQGNIVLAVTYWRLGTKARAAAGPSRSAVADVDHTDDLYFRAVPGRKGRAKRADPNQMDLFGGPKPES